MQRQQASIDRLRQSARLLISFRHEQTKPDLFYRLLANDTVRLVGEFHPLCGASVIDIGGGPGDTSEAFYAFGARPISVDNSWEEMDCRQRDLLGVAAVMADGRRLPMSDDSIDVGCCTNVLEHVPQPVELVTELVRVVRPGGIVFLNYTVWFSPFGGHEMSPWHLVHGPFGAERRYAAKNGNTPKNRYGETLFRYDVAECLRDAQSIAQAEIVDAFPRYLPRWTRPIVRIPGLREIATLNLAVVLRKRPPSAT